MSRWLIGVLGLAALVFTGPAASAAVVIVHNGPRDAPPAAREEHYRARRGYVYTGGRWEYGHRHHYVWSRGRYVHERRGYDYAPGHWDRHDDHYDWYDGEWHPRR